MAFHMTGPRITFISAHVVNLVRLSDALRLRRGSTMHQEARYQEWV